MTELEPQFLEVVSTSGLELRKAFEIMQAGVFAGADLKVTAGAAGRSVDVAAGIGYVNGTHVVDQGRYRIRNDNVKNSDAFTLGGIPANASGLPRLDQIVARVYDQTHDNSGQRKWQLENIVGTPASGATLDTRTGFTVLPLSSLLIADVLVPAAAASIVTANIRDRRLRTRRAERAVYGTPMADLAWSATAYSPFAQNLMWVAPRIECSGGPLLIEAHYVVFSTTTAVNFSTNLWVDGGTVIADTTSMRTGSSMVASAGHAHNRVDSFVYAPAAGSHVIDVAGRVTSGSVTLSRGTGAGVGLLTIRELPENSDNN